VFSPLQSLAPNAVNRSISLYVAVVHKNTDGVYFN